MKRLFSGCISGKPFINFVLCSADVDKYMSDNFQNKCKLLAKIGFSVAFFILGIVLLYSDNSVRQSLGAGFLGIVIGYWVK